MYVCVCFIINIFYGILEMEVRIGSGFPDQGKLCFCRCLLLGHGSSVVINSTLPRTGGADLDRSIMWKLHRCRNRNHDPVFQSTPPPDRAQFGRLASTTANRIGPAGHLAYAKLKIQPAEEKRKRINSCCRSRCSCRLL